MPSKFTHCSLPYSLTLWILISNSDVCQRRLLKWVHLPVCPSVDAMSEYFMNATPLTVLVGSFLNFSDILFMV